MPRNPFTDKDGRALLAKVKTTDGLKRDVERAIKLLGGLERFFKAGDTVLLKPNYVFPNPPPATTALDFLRAVIELFQDNGAGKVIVGESSVQWLNTRKVMEDTGAIKTIEAAGAELHIFDEHKHVMKKIAGAKSKKRSRMPKILDEVDHVVFLPCMKTHHIAAFTGALKLAFGLTHKIERSGHFINIQNKVAEINAAVWPALTIMDGRIAFVAGGPGEGEIRKPNIILASGDRVAVDVEAIKIIQSYGAKNKLPANPWELGQIKRAGEMGVGARSEAEYKVLEG